MSIQFIPQDGKVSTPIATTETKSEPLKPKERFVVRKFIFSEDGEDGWRIRDMEQGGRIMCTCLVEESAVFIAGALNELIVIRADFEILTCASYHEFPDRCIYQYTDDKFCSQRNKCERCLLK